MQRIKSIGKKQSPSLKDGVITQSPPPMTPLESVAFPAPSHAKPGLLQRTRRSLRGSFSSASDGPSVHSEQSTSSSSELHRVSPQSLTFVQRIRMGKSDIRPKPSTPPLLSHPIPRVSESSPRHIPSSRRLSAPTPETPFALSSPPLSFSISSPPPSSALKTAGANIASLGLTDTEGRSKPKMSPYLLSLLVYTVGVKCRGINKKEEYASEHVFSLSEKMANKMMRFGMWDLIKHTKNHLVRTYPKGTRVSSTNYEPHRFWAAGMQLVAMNWQTFGVFILFLFITSFF